MDAYVADWLNLGVRWLHFIAGITWIGSSFYFVWLDNHLEPYPGLNKRIHGELWSVHGGGFYHNQKYLVGPEKLPETLHWFKWEAYTTWLSGMGLLAIVYWYGANAYLIDRSVANLSVGTAIGISIGALVVGWLIYDALCKHVRDELTLGALVFLVLVFAAWGLQRVFGARAAYIHVGAIIGTIMAWNVFFIIIPGQRKMVDAIRAGQPPDPAPGIAGKQRSVHNNYFTLPVLFIMISGHYPMTYGHRHGWLVLGVIMAASVLIRHFFNLRHRGRVVPALPIAAGAMLVGLAIAIAPPGARSGAAKGEVSFVKVNAVIQDRCAGCHAERPTQAGFVQPPAGVMLDAPEKIRAAAQRIHQATVVARTMPMANMTRMTEEERQLIAQWVASGARID